MLWFDLKTPSSPVVPLSILVTVYVVELSTTFSGTKDLVLDGVSKIFRLGSRNVTAKMEWEDFPYLVPGSNHVAVFINTVGITRGVEIKYRPTFL